MLNPVKVDKFLKIERKLKKNRRRLKLLKFIAIQNKNRFNRIEWKNESNITAQFFLHYKDPHWYIISPFSLFRHIWTSIWTLCYLTFLVIMPWRCSMPKAMNMPIMNICQSIVDIIFLIDIPLNFITGIYDPSKRIIILLPSVIAKQYLKGYFTVDLLSSLPYSTVIPALDSHYKFEGMRRRIYILYFLYYIKFIRFSTFISNLRKLLYTLRLGGIAVEVICIILVWLVTSYILITALFFFEDFDDSLLVTLSGSKMSGLMFLHNTTTFIFTVSARLSSLPVGNQFQQMGKLTIMFLTTLVEPFVGATVIVLYWSIRNSDIKFRSMFDEVACYTDSLKAPPHISKKIRKYFKMYYHQATLMEDKKAMDFFSGHDQLVILSNLVENMVMKVELFRDLPPRIGLEVIKLLKREIIFTGYKLTSAGQIGSTMYIVATGKIILFSINFDKISEVSEGSVLGEYQLLNDSPYPMTAVCAEISTIYTLERDQFNKVLYHLTEVYIDIKDKITARYMELLILLERMKIPTTHE